MPGLANYNIVAFVNIVDIPRAIGFYRDTLGLRLVSEEPPFAIVFDANGIMLRLVISQPSMPFTPAQGTVLGWSVANIAEAVKDLAARGVHFERFAQIPQDERGIWTTPTGAKVAWFKDPDGNLLSLSQH